MSFIPIHIGSLSHRDIQHAEHLQVHEQYSVSRESQIEIHASKPIVPFRETAVKGAGACACPRSHSEPCMLTAVQTWPRPSQAPAAAVPSAAPQRTNCLGSLSIG